MLYIIIQYKECEYTLANKRCGNYQFGNERVGMQQMYLLGRKYYILKERN